MKKCTECGEKYDDALVSCPKCMSEGTTPSNLSDKQWEALEMWHKDMHKKNRKIFWAIIAVVALVFPLSIWGIYWSAVRSIKGVIEERVMQEFNEPRIRTTVEDVARGRANEIMEKEITPALISFKEDVNSIIEDINDQSVKAFEYLKRIDLKMFKVLEELSLTMGRISSISVFLMTSTRAESDDRTAFDQLGVWSNDKEYLLSDLAFQAHKRICDKHNQPVRKTGKVPWKEGVDPSKFNLADLERNYASFPPLSYVKPALIYYVYKRTDLPKKGKMEFFARIQKDDDSLRAVEYAGHYFNQEASINFHPLAVEKRLEWWAKNKNSLK